MTVNHCQYFAGDKTFCFKMLCFAQLAEHVWISVKCITDNVKNGNERKTIREMFAESRAMSGVGRRLNFEQSNHRQSTAKLSFH